MVYHYKTHGTCSRAIDIEVDENNVVRQVAFDGGCNGNTKGLAALVKGMPAEEVMSPAARKFAGYARDRFR